LSDTIATEILNRINIEQLKEEIEEEKAMRPIK